MNIATIAPVIAPLRAADNPAAAMAAGFGDLLGMASALPVAAGQAQGESAAATALAAETPFADPAAALPAAAATPKESIAADPPEAGLLVKAPPVSDSSAPAVPVDRAEPEPASPAKPGQPPAKPAETPASPSTEIAVAPPVQARPETMPVLPLPEEAEAADDDAEDIEFAAADISSSDLPVPTLPEASRPARPVPGANPLPSAPPIAAEPAAPGDAPRSSPPADTASAKPRAAPGIGDGASVRETAAAPPANAPDALPSSLFSQALPGAPLRPVAVGQPYGSAHPAPPPPVVAAQPGRIGRDMGVEIARHVAAGREEVLIRLDPAELGRIEVRLSFDREGSLRAVMAADSPAALDMLRREAGDLSRALADAGVRADPQSFRFDSRSGDAGQSWQRGHQGGEGRSGAEGGMARRGGDAGEGEPVYRPLRTSGRIDLMA